MSLFNELKRRNVFKVTIAYVVTAWLVMQVADVVLNNIEAPGWVFRIIMLLMAIGLPFALIFAWAFELTPEGLKRDHEVDRNRSITHDTGRKLDFLIIAVLALALAYFAWDKFITAPKRDAALVQASAVHPAEGPDMDRGPGEKSIAVLPFVNLSSDPEQEFFSDGISEELLNVLAQFPDLRVAARTSSFQFKGQTQDIADIAETLNVAHVLEGSVRKSGSTVRITAQLIKADDGYHLWSSSYDRELTDIFAIQDEISGAIGQALKLKLALADDSGLRPSVIEAANPQAYEAYLRGRQLINRRGRESIEEAVRALEKALRLDANFAPAHAQLAIAISLLLQSPSSYGDLALNEVIARATPHIEKAEALAPDLADVHGAKAILALNQVNNLDTLKHAERALVLNPSYIDAMIWRYLALNSLGRYAEQRNAMGRILEVDPLSVIGRLNYVNFLGWDRRFEQGHAMADDLIAVYPWAGYVAHGNLAVGYEGDLSGALYWCLRAYAADPTDTLSNAYLVRVFLYTGLFDEARRVHPYFDFKADLANGNLEAALVKARRQWQADPGNAAAIKDYANTLYLAGRNDEAEARYEELLAKHPGRPILDVLDGSPEPTVRLAYVRSLIGDEAGAADARALAEADIAAREEANMVDQWVLGAKAMLAVLHDQPELALEAISKAIELGLRDPFFFQEPVMTPLSDNSEFEELRALVDELLATESRNVLQLVCHNNPVPGAWSPLPDTCADGG